MAENLDKDKMAGPDIHEDLKQAYNSMHRLLDLTDIIYPNHSEAPLKIKV